MTRELKITHPHDGDVLNRHDGAEAASEILVPVRGTAPPGAQVLVNGAEAQMQGGEFSCAVPLAKQRNTITAQAGDAADEIAVWWNKGSRKRYRFSIDDNILWLKDLGTRPGDYGSPVRPLVPRVLAADARGVWNQGSYQHLLPDRGLRSDPDA